MYLIIGSSVILLSLLLAAIFYIRKNFRKRLRMLASAPYQIKVGERFKVDLRILNPTNIIQMLDFISINNEILNNFEFIGVLPHAKAKTSAMGSTWISFQREMTSGESFPIELHLQAKNPGNFVGIFSAINDKLLCEEVKVKIEVKGTGAL